MTIVAHSIFYRYTQMHTGKKNTDTCGKPKFFYRYTLRVSLSWTSPGQAEAFACKKNYKTSMKKFLVGGGTGTCTGTGAQAGAFTGAGAHSGAGAFSGTFTGTGQRNLPRLGS